MDIIITIKLVLLLFHNNYFILRASLVAQMVKNLPANMKDPGSIPGLGRSPGEENGKPIQYSCLENSMDRGARWATVLGLRRIEHN